MRDYSYNLVNKATSILCGLAISVILARYLGVSARGELAFILQSGSLVAIVLGLGLSQSFIRSFRVSPSPATFSQVFTLLLLQLVIFGGLAVIVFFVSDNYLLRYISIVAVATSAFQQVEGIMAAYDIRLKMKVHIGYSLVRLTAHIAMWFLVDPDLFAPVLISVTTALLSLVAYLILTMKPRLKIPSLALVQELYGFGWLPMITTLLVVLNYNVDILMLKVFGTSIDLGLYGVAAGVITYMWAIPDSIKEVLLSRVVRSSDLSRVILPLKAAVAASFLSVLLFAGLGWILVPLLFGTEFSGSYYLIVVLSIGVIPMVFYKILGSSVLAEGRRWFYFASLLIAVLANTVLNFIVIPVFGADGAAWASVITYTFTGSAFVLYFGRLSSRSPLDLVFISGSEWNQFRRLIKFF